MPDLFKIPKLDAPLPAWDYVQRRPCGCAIYCDFYDEEDGYMAAYTTFWVPCQSHEGNDVYYQELDVEVFDA